MGTSESVEVRLPMFPDVANAREQCGYQRAHRDRRGEPRDAEEPTAHHVGRPVHTEIRARKADQQPEAESPNADRRTRTTSPHELHDVAFAPRESCRLWGGWTPASVTRSLVS
jgi:hypothetical protein